MSWGTPNFAPPAAGSVIGHNQPPANPEQPASAPFSIAERDRLLAIWDTHKQTLAAAKDAEMVARKAVAEYCFPTPNPGVNRIELNAGYKLKLGHKLNYKVAASNDSVVELEDRAEEDFGPEAKFIIERLFCWKVEVSVSEYKKLDPANNPAHKKLKAAVDQLIEITPGAPSLEIEAPKGAALNG